MNEDNKEKILSQIQKDISEIKTCLVGSFGSYGLVERVNKIEQKNESLTLRVASIASIVPIISTIIIKYACE